MNSSCAIGSGPACCANMPKCGAYASRNDRAAFVWAAAASPSRANGHTAAPALATSADRTNVLLSGRMFVSHSQVQKITTKVTKFTKKNKEHTEGTERAEIFSVKPGVVLGHEQIGLTNTRANVKPATDAGVRNPICS